MKGQTELVGLVLIVLLLAAAGLFYLKFVVLQPDQRPSSLEAVSQSTNLLYGIIHVPLCANFTALDFLDACSSQRTLCDEPQPCSVLEQQLPLIFDPVFHRYIGMNYTFSAQTADEKNPFFKLGMKCKHGSTQARISPRTSNQIYSLSFDLCAKPV
ncbi:hypothetical protein HZB00_02390 [Candidatus Woesearchaeota archaeon]|nr:hypothetical protein [Candidatus Woesearchaeota archaeon]